MCVCVCVYILPVGDQNVISILKCLQETLKIHYIFITIELYFFCITVILYASYFQVDIV